MGIMKENWMNEQESKRDAALAKILGISHSELDSTTWELDNNENKDGIITYSFVRFSDDSPKEVLQKIKGLDESNTVRFDPNALENELN
jgi:predicted mannosyl-3-phosphoglycerate phosphatase (HAD superfamily)